MDDGLADREEWIGSDAVCARVVHPGPLSAVLQNKEGTLIYCPAVAFGRAPFMGEWAYLKVQPNYRSMRQGLWKTDYDIYEILMSDRY